MDPMYDSRQGGAWGGTDQQLQQYLGQQNAGRSPQEMAAFNAYQNPNSGVDQYNARRAARGANTFQGPGGMPSGSPGGGQGGLMGRTGDQFNFGRGGPFNFGGNMSGLGSIGGGFMNNPFMQQLMQRIQQMRGGGPQYNPNETRTLGFNDFSNRPTPLPQMSDPLRPPGSFVGNSITDGLNNPNVPHGGMSGNSITDGLNPPGGQNPGANWAGNQVYPYSLAGRQAAMRPQNTTGFGTPGFGFPQTY
jgi:hypothetical protein